MFETLLNLKKGEQMSLKFNGIDNLLNVVNTLRKQHNIVLLLSKTSKEYFNEYFLTKNSNVNLDKARNGKLSSCDWENLFKFYKSLDAKDSGEIFVGKLNDYDENKFLRFKKKIDFIVIENENDILVKKF